MTDTEPNPEPTTGPATEWIRVADLDELDEGRVKTVVAGVHSLALTRCNGAYGALDNRCPHQGGPLGEGSIEDGLLRCPWHGYDYDPTTRQTARGLQWHSPACFGVEERSDGVYVAVPVPEPHVRTVSDVMVETMVAWGIAHVFGMVGHSNLGFADAMRRQEEAGNLRFIGIRHEGAAATTASAYGKLTGRPAACFGIAGPGSTNLLTGLYDAKVDRAPVLAISGQVPSKVLGRGAFQDLDLPRGLRRRGRVVPHGARRLGPRGTDVARREARPGGARGRPPRAPRRGAGAAAPRRAHGFTRRAGRRSLGGPTGCGSRRGGRPPRRGPSTGLRGGPRCPLRHARRPHAGRVGRCADPHHLQGQGPGVGPPPARRRRARSQRHPGSRAGT